MQFYEALQQRLLRVPGRPGRGGRRHAADRRRFVRQPEHRRRASARGPDVAATRRVPGRPPRLFRRDGRSPAQRPRRPLLGHARDSPPVIVVNETLAREGVPGPGSRSATGSGWIQRRTCGRGSSAWSATSGTSARRHRRGPKSISRHSQRSFPFMAFVVRTEADPYADRPGHPRRRRGARSRRCRSRD